MVARGVSCRWEKRNTRARTWSGCVGAFRLTLWRAHTRRPYAARPAICGSVMPMLRMNGGIRACNRQLKWLVRRRSHRFPSRGGRGRFWFCLFFLSAGASPVPTRSGSLRVGLCKGGEVDVSFRCSPCFHSSEQVRLIEHFSSPQSSRNPVPPHTVSSTSLFSAAYKIVRTNAATC